VLVHGSRCHFLKFRGVNKNAVIVQGAKYIFSFFFKKKKN